MAWLSSRLSVRLSLSVRHRCIMAKRCEIGSRLLLYSDCNPGIGFSITYRTDMVGLSEKHFLEIVEELTLEEFPS